MQLSSVIVSASVLISPHCFSFGKFYIMPLYLHHDSLLFLIIASYSCWCQLRFALVDFCDSYMLWLNLLSPTLSPSFHYPVNVALASSTASGALPSAIGLPATRQHSPVPSATVGSPTTICGLKRRTTDWQLWLVGPFVNEIGDDFCPPFQVTTMGRTNRSSAMWLDAFSDVSARMPAVIGLPTTIGELWKGQRT